MQRLGKKNSQRKLIFKDQLNSLGANRKRNQNLPSNPRDFSSVKTENTILSNRRENGNPIQNPRSGRTNDVFTLEQTRTTDKKKTDTICRV